MTPTLEQCMTELQAAYGGIAVLVNECMVPGGGNRILELPTHESLTDVGPSIDLSKTRFGPVLPVWYRYAYEGVVPYGQGGAIEPDDTLGELFDDFLDLFSHSSPYFELCLWAADNDFRQYGCLRAMFDRLKARHALDGGDSLSVEQIALLADMNERSVRNATGKGGDLTLNEQGDVDNHVARIWLEQRGVRPSVVRTLPADRDVLPESLDAVEIPAFVRERLYAIWGENGMDALVRMELAANAQTVEVPAFLERAAKWANIEPERLFGATQLPLSIRPDDCAAIARAIQVDVVWLTLQVMSALYPEQVDMILNPQNYRSQTDAPTSESIESVTVTLTEAMIEHGYLDIPMVAKDLFPEDSFGDRSGEKPGQPILLSYGGKTVETELRIKSTVSFSPRKRFGAWFQRELGAKPGDRIVVKRTAPRSYQLEYAK